MHQEIIKEILMLQHYHSECAEFQKPVVCEMLCKLINQIPVDGPPKQIPDEDEEKLAVVLRAGLARAIRSR